MGHGSIDGGAGESVGRKGREEEERGHEEKEEEKKGGRRNQTTPSSGWGKIGVGKSVGNRINPPTLELAEGIRRVRLLSSLVLGSFGSTGKSSLIA